MQQPLHRLWSRFRAGPRQKGQQWRRRRSDSVGTMKLKMKNLAMRFVRDETGATAIEYGLIVAAISVSIMAVIQGIGSRLNTTFISVEAGLR